MKTKILIALLFFLTFFFAPQVFAQEKIENFGVQIKINSDSSINISERIEYDFSALQRHGIFRDIPIKYQARGGNFNLRISDISVADVNGTPYNFTTSYPGNNIQIKIGDPNQFVSGQKIYIINYKINRAINYFSDHDELYWNATGNGWSVPIDTSSATVNYPQNITMDKIQAACFIGAFGSNESCWSHNYGEDKAIFFEGRSLPPGQGLTIVVGWPKGIVSQPSAIQKVLYILADNWILFLPLLTFLVMLYLWFKLGRDPRGRGTIIAQYDAPDNLTPVQIGTLIDEKVDTKDISAEIIYLATKGYIKITRTENKGIIFKSEDYILEKLREDKDLPPFDQRLMKGLFLYETTKSVKLSDLKNKFYKELPDIKDKINSSLVLQGYFPEKPSKVQGKYITLGILIAGGCVLLIKVSDLLKTSDILGQSLLGTMSIISLVTTGIIIIIFGIAMPVKTQKGVIAKENIFGLKEYLQVAEKDRIKFHNAPEKNPEHFEKLLPYAMVLGVEKEWAKQFEGIYNQPPSWYSDPSGGIFNSLILISALNNFSHSANSALISAPRSAAGGGSGFGGGGFSGGGFGGGGGGSW